MRTVFLTLLAAVAMAAALTPPNAHKRTESVSVLTKQLESGAVEVDVTVVKFKGSATLIRLVDEDEAVGCNPFDPMTRQLDMRDSYDVMRDITGRAVSGVWNVIDSADAGTRTYSAVLSPARIRQQLAGIDPPGTNMVQGAVTGGSALAKLYACLYHVADGPSVEVYGETNPAVTIHAQSGPNAPAADVEIYAQLPVTYADDSSAQVTLTIETTQTSCDGSATAYVQTGETKINGQAATVTHSSAVDVGSMCKAGANGCISCTQTMTINAAADASPSPMLDATLKLLLVMSPASGAHGTYLTRAPHVFAHLLVPTRIPSQPLTVRTEDGEIVKKTADRPVTVAVKSAGHLTSIRGAVTRRARDELTKTPAADVIAATLYDGKTSCLTLTMSEPKEGAKLFIDDAVLIACTKRKKTTGECIDKVSRKLAHGGAVTGDTARFSSGKIKMTAGGETELCFVPNFGPADCTIDVSWSVRTNHASRKAAANAVADAKARDAEGPARDYHEHEHEHEHEHHPGEEYALAEWCLAHPDNCTGVIIIQSVVQCDERTRYDSARGTCVAREDAAGYGGWMGGWREHPGGAIFVALFIVVIIIIGVIICCGAYHNQHLHGGETPKKD